MLYVCRFRNKDDAADVRGFVLFCFVVVFFLRFFFFLLVALEMILKSSCSKCTNRLTRLSMDIALEILPLMCRCAHMPHGNKLASRNLSHCTILCLGRHLALCYNIVVE